MSDIVPFKETIVPLERSDDPRSKDLSKRIEEIRLDPEKEAEIAAKAGGKIIRDKVLGAFVIGQVAQAVLTWNENVDKEIKSAKREILLGAYLDKSDQNEAAIDQLKRFITDPRGNTLFNKLIRILDDNPPDPELTAHLSSALKHMSETAFERLFEEHKYALSQIEQLTPQSLTLLSDHGDWPPMRLTGALSTSGASVKSDWLQDFCDAYASSKGVSDRALTNRLHHSLVDLFNKRFITAKLLGSVENRKASCVLTQVGLSIVAYLDPGYRSARSP
ncbi:MAG: hypothetical protein JHD07_13710 [Bradyrhizobium sp.]|uniref:hypothetical protein n=1 Tax=Bradyrhizobium sp. TaxID=376 RepID=UPI001A1F9A22|nr:hypothetical protein [Bradyrhizobium sp.]MBJ7404287.1 hypothetical protein [Bradyrhizobium sp.]